MNIAIDGPAGSGKSSVAKSVAKKIGFVYVDTGSMYRAMALKALNNNVNIDDNEEVRRLISETSFSLDRKKLLIDSNPISDKIRDDKVTSLSSKIAINRDIRNFLVSEQRKIAENNNVVMEGRDIGTVVLKQSKNKFYLDANPEVRAERRLLQKNEEFTEANLKNTISSIRERDERDSSREIDPLRIAEDAKYIDTSNLTLEEVVDIIINELKR
ncbi:MAG: CMP/dCMP kinase [Kosmotogales bacterium]|nr:CMP/dCMP kinase [Kosmotogales bacterium]